MSCEHNTRTRGVLYPGGIIHQTCVLCDEIIKSKAKPNEIYVVSKELFQHWGDEADKHIQKILDGIYILKDDEAIAPLLEGE